MTDQTSIRITPDHAGHRLDKVIADLIPDISRSRFKNLIKAGQVTFSSGRAVTSPSQKVKIDEKYIITIPEAEDADPQPENLNLDVSYEDDDLIVINKPAGMVVHPAPGSYSGTLVNGLLHHCKGSLSGIGGVRRPGIVHRIDKDTSGLLVVAKNDKSHHGLAQQFSDHTIHRLYAAVCKGQPDPVRDKIVGNIGRHSGDRKKMAVVSDLDGKWAATHYRTLENYQSGSKPIASLIECKLETGRTHQVRVHMQSRGHALIGDPLYNPTHKLASGIHQHVRSAISAFKRQALHAKHLQFTHPISGQVLTFDSELPSDMNDLVQTLRTYGHSYPAKTTPFVP